MTVVLIVGGIAIAIPFILLNREIWRYWRKWGHE